MTATRISNYGDEQDLLSCILDLAAGAQDRLWIKIPWWDTSESAAAVLDEVLDAKRRGVDVLVLCRPESSNDAILRSLRSNDVTVVPVRYIHEKEVIADNVLVAHSMNFTRMEIERNQNSGFIHNDSTVVHAAVAGFEQLRSNAAAVQVGDEAWTAASRLLPDRWLKYIDRPRINPLQSKAIPAVLSTDGHVMVVAPTSSGKTLVGEVAALRSILDEGKTAVWLLPARALAAEVAETAERWRKHGIRSVQLTGEVNLSSASIRQAQLWVATTEKFESLYRRSSLSDYIGNIGCLIIDEVHLVGDESRGATLESLIARLRQAHERTRIVALSATVSNADEVAEWFKADLIRTDWRPTVLTTQLVPYKVAPDARWAEKEAAKNRALRPLLADLRDNTDDPATVLVFCGSKKGVQSVAVMAAGTTTSGSLETDVETCFKAGVGMHFRDAPRSQRALESFRSRNTSILVATSGLSTGVNTPARAVIIRDLQLGITPLEVSQAQQMLGRAGRAGQEEAGFGFILVPEDEMSSWRVRLSDGYTVKSHIIENIADAVLAEVLLGTVTSRETADSWFEETFAYSLGATDARLAEEINFLVLNGFVTETNNVLSITPIGMLTSRLMVDVASAAALLSAIARAPLPNSAIHAEQLVVSMVTAAAIPLASYPVNENTAGSAVSVILADWMPTYLKQMGSFGSRFCAAAAQLALYDAQTLRAKPKQDMPLGDFRRAVEDMPRYFAWVAALGYADTQSWVPAVAGDLTRRLTWWNLSPQPERGGGRLLWLLEKILEPQNQRTKMQNIWASARRSDVSSPDQVNALPANADASPERFGQILQGRANLLLADTSADGAALKMSFQTNTRSNRLTVRTHRGLQPAITTLAPAEREIYLTLPPADPHVADVAVDAFLFTSDGDWAYDSTIGSSTGMPAGHDPIESARQAAQLLSQTFVVAVRKNWRSALKRGHRKQLELVTSLIAPTPGLHEVGLALSGHDPDPTRAAWFLSDRLPQLLEVRAGGGEPRHPVSVLHSGYSSEIELQYCLAALMRSLQMDAGIAVAGDGSPVSVVELDGAWHLLAPAQHGSLTAVYPDSLSSTISVLRPPAAQEAIAVTPVLLWVDEFSAQNAMEGGEALAAPAADNSTAEEDFAEVVERARSIPQPPKPEPVRDHEESKHVGDADRENDPPDASDFIAEKRKIHKNAYAPWTADDDERLLRLNGQGLSVRDLMGEFQRNDGSIRSRLKKLTDGNGPNGVEEIPTLSIPADSGSEAEDMLGTYEPSEESRSVSAFASRKQATTGREWAAWGDKGAPLLPAAVRYLDSARVSPLDLQDVDQGTPTALADLDGTTVRPLSNGWSTDSKNQAVKAFGLVIYDWSFPHLLKQSVMGSEVLTSMPEIEISDSWLSVRAKNCLESADIRYVSDLNRFTWRDLLEIRQLGHRSLIEILCSLESMLTSLDLFDLDSERARHQLIAPVKGHWSMHQSMPADSTTGSSEDTYRATGVWLKRSASYQPQHDRLEMRHGQEQFEVELIADFNTSGKSRGETYLRALVKGEEIGVIPTRFRRQCPDFFDRAEVDDITVLGQLLTLAGGDRLVRLSDPEPTF